MAHIPQLMGFFFYLGDECSIRILQESFCGESDGPGLLEANILCEGWSVKAVLGFGLRERAGDQTLGSGVAVRLRCELLGVCCENQIQA